MIEIEKSPVIKMFTEKARMEALIEGRTEGRAEGRIEGYTDALMKIILKQYGKVGLQELEPQIRAIGEEKKLTALMESALDSTSFEEFKKILATTI